MNLILLLIFQESILSGTEAIQAILAPAIGISATALLLLSLSNRFSSIIDRIRLLNEERRGLLNREIENKGLDYHERVRQMSVIQQIKGLLARCKDVRNSILYVQSSILVFVLTSVLIAVNIFISTKFFRSLPLIIFAFGMILLLIGIVYSAKDVTNSYKIAVIEVKADD